MGHSMTGPSEDKLICRCYGVPAGRVRRAITDRDLRHVEEVTACTRAGAGCSSCWDDLQAILGEVHGAPPARHEPDATGLTPAQKRARVVEVIEREAAELLELNGLHLQLVEVGSDRVLARFSGDLAGSTSAAYLALKRWLVERFSGVCGRKMMLVELNVLEAQAAEARRQ